jgi:hypothetical protein
MPSEVFLNKDEVRLILPVLERVLAGVANERHRKQYVTVQLPLANPVYERRAFDEEIFSYVLSCRNKVKQIGSSRKLRLNPFEVSALALATRVSLKVKSSHNEVVSGARFALKLEKLRKRAKRAWIRRRGVSSFRDTSLRWKRFVEWLRFEILAPSKRRSSRLESLEMIQREQREFMRDIARTIASAEADIKQMLHLADLARREVKRNRHPFTMRELIADKQKAELFLADFVLKRLGHTVLKSAYQPLCVRMSAKGKEMQAALTVTVPNPKLQRALERWIDREIDPEYLDAVREEIAYQLGFDDLHYISARCKGTHAVVRACKPEYNADTDLRSFYAVWAARWLLALQPDKDLVRAVVGPAFRAAKANWENLSPLTRQRKLNQITARYYSEPDPSPRCVHPFAA